MAEGSPASATSANFHSSCHHAETGTWLVGVTAKISYHDGVNESVVSVNSMLMNLYFILAIGSWFFILFFGDKLGGQKGKKTQGVAVIYLTFGYLAFVFWSAVVLGIWERELLIVAAIGSIPGLLATILLLSSLVDVLRGNKN
ncbi:MAG: hypothetical protein ACE5IP_04455 [Terriglobia bacterium]